MGEKNLKLITFLILIFSIAGLSINMNHPELRGEEPLRIMVSYEMDYFNNFLKPTLFGEPYTHKPPLYNWFIILSSKIFGWNEATVRFLSVFFTAVTGLSITFFSYLLFRNFVLALLSGVIYLTFLDVIAYYGWIGEMDSIFTFFVFVLFILVFYGFYIKKDMLFYIAGIYTGFIFLFKGFNAFPFFALSYIAGVLFFRRIDLKHILNFTVSMFLSLIIPLVWFFSLGNFGNYFTDLSGEVVNRVENNFNLIKSIKHIVTYPILNFKQLLLSSLFILIGFLFYRKKMLKDTDRLIWFLVIIAGLNYIPYILLAGGSGMYTIHGRHIMPIFPLLAIVFGYFLYKLKEFKLFYVFVFSMLLLALIRIPYGTEVLYNLGKPSRKNIAVDMAKTTKYNKNVSCDKSCKNEKAVCFYYSVITNSITLSPNVNKNWDYIISCEYKKNFSVIKKYKGKFKTIYLYKKGEDQFSKSSPVVFQ